ncbi:hypothetical protein [Actinobacillus ureae]|nr:hypothetical protein [Actinobacillus ureae]
MDGLEDADKAEGCNSKFGSNVVSAREADINFEILGYMCAYFAKTLSTICVDAVCLVNVLIIVISL